MIEEKLQKLESFTSALADGVIEAMDSVLKELSQLQADNRLQAEAGPRGGIRD